MTKKFSKIKKIVLPKCPKCGGLGRERKKIKVDFFVRHMNFPIMWTEIKEKEIDCDDMFHYRNSY